MFWGKFGLSYESKIGCFWGVFTLICAFFLAGCDGGAASGDDYSDGMWYPPGGYGNAPHFHQWGPLITTKSATCVETGSAMRTCLLDWRHTEPQIIPIDDDAHDWDEWVGTITCTTPGTGTRFCRLSDEHIEERGEGDDPLGHEFESYFITQYATCTDEGAQMAHCVRYSACGETDIQPVPINDDAHNWNDSYAVTTPSTCSATGTATDTCARNAAHTRTQDVAINPDAHNWNNSYVTTTPPTCSSTGTETDTCAHNIAHTRPRLLAIAPNAHNYQWVTVTAATFIAGGSEKERCSLCADETGSTHNTAARLITNNADWTSARNLLTGVTGNYTLTIGNDFDVTGNTAYTFGTTTPAGGLTVTLKGSGRMSAFGSIIGTLIRLGDHQTLIIDGDITLQGSTHGNNTGSVVYISGFTAQLELNNGTIRGNTISPVTDSYSCSGAGVSISGGSFIMRGGEISSNSAITSVSNGSAYGAGVYVGGGTFTMWDGKISNNQASACNSSGGGVFVSEGSTFTMRGGEISNNHASGKLYTTANSAVSGGGVKSYGTFTMHDGKISGNSARIQGSTSNPNPPYSAEGGGVYVGYDGLDSIFIMRGGEISGNVASITGINHSSSYPSYASGGGVYVGYRATFAMRGGEIAGNYAVRYGSGFPTPAPSRGGGVYVNSLGTFYMESGTVYGLNAAADYLKNIAEGYVSTNPGRGAALDGYGTHERGYFIDNVNSTWTGSGTLPNTSDNTIRVSYGALQ
jgi:hypothetical protein